MSNRRPGYLTPRTRAAIMAAGLAAPLFGAGCAYIPYPPPERNFEAAARPETLPEAQLAQPKQQAEWPPAAQPAAAPAAPEPLASEVAAAPAESRSDGWLGSLLQLVASAEPEAAGATPAESGMADQLRFTEGRGGTQPTGRLGAGEAANTAGRSAPPQPDPADDIEAPAMPPSPLTAAATLTTLAAPRIAEAMAPALAMREPVARKPQPETQTPEPKPASAQADAPPPAAERAAMPETPAPAEPVALGGAPQTAAPQPAGPEPKSATPTADAKTAALSLRERAAALFLDPVTEPAAAPSPSPQPVAERASATPVEAEPEPALVTAESVTQPAPEAPLQAAPVPDAARSDVAGPDSVDADAAQSDVTETGAARANVIESAAATAAAPAEAAAHDLPVEVVAEVPVMRPGGGTATDELAAAAEVSPAAGSGGEASDADGAETGKPTQLAAIPSDPLPVSGQTRILFDPASAVLSPSAQDELATLADRLAESDKARITILGYGDGGAQAGNAGRARILALSRVMAVRRFLMVRGLTAERLVARAMGNQMAEGPAGRVDIMVGQL